MLILKAGRNPADDSATSLYSPLLMQPDADSSMAAGLQYGVGPLQAHARVSQRSWLNHGMRVLGSEVGATYDAGDYSVGLSVGATSTPHRNVPLPRVLGAMSLVRRLRYLNRLGWCGRKRPSSYRPRVCRGRGSPALPCGSPCRAGRGR